MRVVLPWSAMLPILLLAIACFDAPAPDPDALLRAGDLDGVAVAWEALHGTALDVRHPAAQALAIRAPRDPSITAATLVDTLLAIRFLENAPLTRTETLDFTFTSLADFGAALDVLADGPAMMAVGRSETRADKDPYTTNAPLPWKGGRLVGHARKPASGASGAFEAFGATVDANPPVKLVTIGLADSTGMVYISIERREGRWFVLGTSDAHVGARLVLASETVRESGAAVLREREGRGFVRR